MSTLVLNIEKICRVCMIESNKYQSIYSVFDILKNCTAIEISQDDGLPKKICNSCINKAKLSSEFKIQCENSDKILRNLINSKKNLVKIDNVNIVPKEEKIKREPEYNDYAVVSEFTENSQIAKYNSSLTQTEQLKCFKCCAVFKNAESLRSHIKLHLDDSNLCYICKCGFKDKSNLLDHNETNHNTECSKRDLEYCGDNDLSFEIKSQVICELGKKKRGRPVKQSKGNSKSIKNEQELKYKCKHCDESFNRKMFLKRHILTDHADDNNLEKLFECEECKKSYSNYELLLLHMKGHIGIFDCTICLKKFPRLDIYVEHKKRHSNERKYLCNKCGKGYFNQIYLDKHMLTHNNDHLEKPTYDCKICGKKLKHSNHLQVHMRTHIDRTQPMHIINPNPNRKLILCSVCGKSCSSSSNLAVHMRRHTGEMTSFCKICGKGYPRTTDLTLHMRSHTGEKPFLCHICKRGFARSDKLAIHMRTHSGEKPYICICCGKAFAQSNDLASHKRRNLCGQQVNNQVISNNTITYTVSNNDHKLNLNGVHVTTVNNLVSETQTPLNTSSNINVCSHNYSQKFDKPISLLSGGIPENKYPNLQIPQATPKVFSINSSPTVNFCIQTFPQKFVNNNMQ